MVSEWHEESAKCRPGLSESRLERPGERYPDTERTRNIKRNGEGSRGYDGRCRHRERPTLCIRNGTREEWGRRERKERDPE